MDGVKAPRKSHSAARMSESPSSFHTHAHQHVVVLAHVPRCRPCVCQTAQVPLFHLSLPVGISQVKVQDVQSLARWRDSDVRVENEAMQSRSAHEGESLKLPHGPCP